MLLKPIFATAFLVLVATPATWQREDLPEQIVENRPRIAIHAAAGGIWSAWMGEREVHLLRQRPGETWSEVGKVPVRGYQQIDLVMSVVNEQILLAYVSHLNTEICTSILRWHDGKLEYLGSPIKSAGGALHVSLAAGQSSDGDFYAAWEELGLPVATRVVHWHDGRWNDFGPPPNASARYFSDPSLALDSGGRPWLAWNDADRVRKKTSLRVARYNGKEWQDMAMPARLVNETLSPDHIRLHPIADGSMALVLSQAGHNLFLTSVLKWSSGGWFREAPPISESRESTLIDSKVVEGKLVLVWFKPRDEANTEIDVAVRDASHWVSCPALISDLRVIRVYIAGGSQSQLSLAVDNLAGVNEIGKLARIDACN
jgi:hypothetical protein